MKVTFCGHKELADRTAVKQWLQSVCQELILQGAAEFYLGGYGAFDSLCASVLREFKPANNHIQLILVLPYLNSSIITDGYDETIYPPLESVPKKIAILRRNEWMVLYLPFGMNSFSQNAQRRTRVFSAIILDNSSIAISRTVCTA